MEASKQDDFLDRLATEVLVRWEEAEEDRRLFLGALVALGRGEVEEAAGRFRRAARCAPEPFCYMAQLGHGRCEVLRGHEGIALKIFKEFVGGNGPDELKQLAWMEVADLGRGREDQDLVARACRELRMLAR